MLTCESVRSTDSPHFAMLDALYARAFPWHEQRESEAKRQALSHPRYALEAWFDEGVFVGLSGCWQFAGYGYIEHLAIDDTLRSRGYGKQLLAQILTRAPLTILEIDPLTTAIAINGCAFISRWGSMLIPGRIIIRPIIRALRIMSCWCSAIHSRSVSGSISSLPGISGTR